MRDTPIVEVSIEPEGSPKVRVDVSDCVMSLEYEDCENKADKLSLTVDNHDLSNFDDPIWRKGNRVHVSWGYADAMSVVRVCQIRKVIGFQELKIEALGREVELNTEHKVRVFEGRSRSDVAREIAEEWGFRDEALLHIQSTKIVREHIAQARQTDAQFMKRLAAKEGFEWYIDHDGFHFHERNFYQPAIKVLHWFADPDRSEIQDITVENDVTKRAGSVSARSHNPLTRKTLEVASDQTTETKRPVLGSVVDAPGKTEKNVPGFKSVAHHTVMCTTELDEEGAKRAAAAVFRGAQQRAVKLSVTIEGDPNIQAKSVIEVRGIGKRLSQRYYVRTATHTISGAYITKLACVSDGTGGHSTKSTLVTGASAVQVGPKLKGKSLPLTRKSLEVPGAPATPPGAPGSADTPTPLATVPQPDGSVSYAPVASGGVPGVESASSEPVSSETSSQQSDASFSSEQESRPVAVEATDSDTRQTAADAALTDSISGFLEGGTTNLSGEQSYKLRTEQLERERSQG